MHTDHEQFARLEVATVTGRLPRDLGEWLVRRLAVELEADQRRADRDRLLRQAAALIPGTLAGRIAAIQAEERRLQRRPTIHARRDFTGMVAAAMQRNGGRLPSARHLRRILE